MGISLIYKINGKFTYINGHSIFAIILYLRPFPYSSLKIEILTRFSLFLFKPDTLVYLLKNMGGRVMGGCVSLFFFNFKKEK